MSNLPTSPAKQAASLDTVVDRLFMRLHAMYGKAWLDLWADAPVAHVKAVWADTLRNVSPEQMRLAIDELAKNGKPFPPTLPEFANLCEQYRPKSKPSLYLASPRHDAPEGVIRSLRQILDQAGGKA